MAKDSTNVHLPIGLKFSTDHCLSEFIIMLKNNNIGNNKIYIIF